MKSTSLALFLSILIQAISLAEERPNIVFLLADDLAASGIGSPGNPDVQTPHLDQLIRDGVDFRKHYCTTSICMASRCSILTGLYEYRHGCNFQLGDLPSRFMDESYADQLRRSGYFVGFAGKVGFLMDGQPLEALSNYFDRWAGEPGHVTSTYATTSLPHIKKYAEAYPHCTRAYGAWASDFVREAKNSRKPFCLSISLWAPHQPFKPDPVDRRLYLGKSFSRPKNFGVESSLHLSAQARSSRSAVGYAREWQPSQFDTTVAEYYSMITGVDATLGMIRETLRQEGLADNTVIVFTSDNGFNGGSHGFGDKVLPYEEGCKAPLIIYDPRCPSHCRGVTCDELTGNIDLAATLLDLAELTVPRSMDGKSLVPLLTNPAQAVHSHLPLFNFWGIHSAQSMAIVTRQSKYIFWYFGTDGFTPTEELFQLDSDPIEMHNRATESDAGETLRSMRKLYAQELARLKENVIRDRPYEVFPILFDRAIDWEAKQALMAKLPIPNAGAQGLRSK